MPPFVRNALQSDAFHEFLKLLTAADFGFEFRRFIIMAGFFELFGKFFGFSLLGFLGNLRFIGIDSGRGRPVLVRLGSTGRRQRLFRGSAGIFPVLRQRNP